MGDLIYDLFFYRSDHDYYGDYNSWVEVIVNLVIIIGMIVIIGWWFLSYICSQNGIVLDKEILIEMWNYAIESWKGVI